MTNTNDPHESAGEPDPAARAQRLQALFNATRNRLRRRPARQDDERAAEHAAEHAVGEAVDEAMRVDPQDLPLFQEQQSHLEQEARARPQDQTPAVPGEVRVEINDSGETAEEFLARIALMGPDLWHALSDDELSAMNEGGWQVCIEHVEGVTAATKLAITQTTLSMALMKAPCTFADCTVPGCTDHVRRLDGSPHPASWLVEELHAVAGELDRSLIAQLAPYLDQSQCPGAAFALTDVELQVASDIMSLPLWTWSPDVSGPSPAQVKKMAKVMDAPMYAVLDVSACVHCTLTDTPAEDTHWLIEVATIYSPAGLNPDQTNLFTDLAATCGAEFYQHDHDGSTNGVMYVGPYQACPPHCTAHTDNRRDCRPRPGRKDTAGTEHPPYALNDRLEDALRAEVARQLGPTAEHQDQLGGRSLEQFPEELLRLLRPILDPAGLYRDRGSRRWFTVTLPMQTAARIIVNWNWAPELDMVERNPNDDDLSGYCTIASSRAAHWLLSVIHCTDQHWTMRLRFTDLTGMKPPWKVPAREQSSAHPGKNTGSWTVGIDWLRVDMDPRPDIATPVLVHQARNQMLKALDWTSYSHDHPEMAPHQLGRECGLIDFRDSPYSTGPKPGDVCSCGGMTGTAGTLIAPPTAPDPS